MLASQSPGDFAFLAYLSQGDCFMLHLEKTLIFVCFTLSLKVSIGGFYHLSCILTNLPHLIILFCFSQCSLISNSVSLSRFYALSTDFNFLPFLFGNFWLVSSVFPINFSFENLSTHMFSFGIMFSMKMSNLIMSLLLLIFNFLSFILRPMTQKWQTLSEYPNTALVKKKKIIIQQWHKCHDLNF